MFILVMIGQQYFHGKKKKRQERSSTAKAIEIEFDG
jgi:hypothetical protein